MENTTTIPKKQTQLRSTTFCIKVDPQIHEQFEALVGRKNVDSVLEQFMKLYPLHGANTFNILQSNPF